MYHIHLVNICTIKHVQFSKGVCSSLRLSLARPVNSQLQYLSTWQKFLGFISPNSVSLGLVIELEL
jgi:hypothetical protein